MNAAFRVLTLTTSEKRRDNLRALAQRVDGRGQASQMFLFAWEGDFSLERPESLLEPIWQCGVGSCQKCHCLVR